MELRAASKVYGTGAGAVVALHSTDLAIHEREFIAIMGPSGSGKSTLMNILGCLDVQSSGSYLFEGSPVEALSRRERGLLRRLAFGFVFQGFNLLTRTTAVENVELPLLYRGENAGRRRRAALDALAAVGLADRAGHYPSELSGGQQQRVAIARAIVAQPQVVLADEPTGNLDTERSEEMIGLLRTIGDERGIAIVVITHEPEIAAHAHRTLLVRDGRLAVPDSQMGAN